MNWNKYFENLEFEYRIEINQQLRNIIQEHFENEFNIYTEQDLYEQTQKIIQDYQYRHKRYEF